MKGPRLIQQLPALILAVITPLPLAYARPQTKWWETKDWKQWSEEECKQVLTNSPWAGDNENRSSANFGSVKIQFLTALPIREALTRLALIKKKYDKRNASQRQAIEKQIVFPDVQQLGDQIIVRVEVPMTATGGGGVSMLTTESPGHYSGGTGDKSTPGRGNENSEVGEFTPGALSTMPNWSSLGFPKTGDRGVLVLANGLRVNSIGRIPQKRYRYTRFQTRQYELLFPRAVNGYAIGEPGHEIVAVVLVGELKTKSVHDKDWEFWRVNFNPEHMTYKGRLDF